MTPVATPTSAPSGAAPAEASSPLVVGASLDIALVAAAVWAGVTVVRLGSAGAPGAAIAVIALGGAALTLGPLVVASRVARPLSAPLVDVLVGAALAAAPLATFGAVLRERTHHRALGGVTYAVAAVAIVAVAWLASRRILVAERRSSSGPSRAGRSALLLAAAASLGLSVAWLGPALSASAPGVRDCVVDVLTGVALGLVAAQVPPYRCPPHLARAGGPLWALAAVAGLVTVWVAPAARSVMEARSPAVLGVLHLLVR